MAPTSRTRRAVFLGLALLSGVAAGCEQADDVVANLSALSDGGGEPAGSVAPMPVAMPTPDAGAPRCETSQIYVLLSSIVRNQCLVESASPSTLGVLLAFFLQNPPTRGPAEMRQVSTCDILAGPYNFAYKTDQDTTSLCPDHCETAKRWVAAEDQRVLECQGFGGS